MNQSSRVYIAGHRGLVGSALARVLSRRGYRDVITRSHKALDLRDTQAVTRFLAEAKPDVIFLAAARVGGILANYTQPAEFICDNLAIETNVIHEAAKAEVNSLLFFGSSCMYPRDAAQPIRESALMTGPLEPTNQPYGGAKIAGAELVGPITAICDAIPVRGSDRNLWPRRQLRLAGESRASRAHSSLSRCEAAGRCADHAVGHRRAAPQVSCTATTSLPRAFI